MSTELMNHAEELRERAKLLGVTLSDRQLEQFLLYYDMLVSANEKFNLTALVEWKDVLEKHFLDSIALASTLMTGLSGLRLIDVGSGAGFPGVPLKIAIPGLQVTLLDTQQKRVGFLRELIETLELENIQAVQARAEDLGRDPAHRMMYDIAVSRAVAPLPILLEYCTPFVKVGGEFVAYKSGNTDKEIADSVYALEELSCSVRGILYPQIPGTDLSRSLIRIHRDQELDIRYPRRAGIPEKRPL